MALVRLDARRPTLFDPTIVTTVQIETTTFAGEVVAVYTSKGYSFRVTPHAGQSMLELFEAIAALVER